MRKWAWTLALALLCCTACLCAAQGEQPVTITDRAGLKAVRERPSGAYCLAADIDLGGAPWQPFLFSGTLEGAGHTVYNIAVNAPDGTQRRTTVDGNHKEYDTCFAGLFSVCENASISNLTIRNIVIDIDTQENCFIGGAAGYTANCTLENVTVSGRLLVTSAGRMFGAGGLVGFGRLIAKNCEIEVTLATTDPADDAPCEEFLGGVLGCGYGTISGCAVRLDGYASVHGYVHSGGLVGMHHIHVKKDQNRTFWMKNCTIRDSAIHFFEDVGSRRAYCGAYVGENLHNKLSLDRNKRVNFTRDETDDYSRNLLPEMCENPAYAETVTAPTADAFGFTTFTCASCGYAYTDCYTAPGN